MAALFFGANAFAQQMMRAAPLLGALVMLTWALLFSTFPFVLHAVAYHDLRGLKEGVDTSRLEEVFE